MSKTGIPDGSFPAQKLGKWRRYPFLTKGPLLMTEPAKPEPDQDDTTYVARALDAVDAVLKARP